MANANLCSPVTRVMKLDQRKIHWIIRQKQKVVATKQIAQDMKISRRRVQQIWKSYAEGKQEPAMGENMGRPRKPFDGKEAQVVGEAYTLYRFGARMLEVAVRKVFKIRVPRYFVWGVTGDTNPPGCQPSHLY
jgi:putative transposase